MRDDRLDDQLRDGAREYNEPPETPRDEMWAAIQAKRTAVDTAVDAVDKEAEEAETESGRILPFRSVRPSRFFRLAAGIAAVLALGIGLGRISAPSPIVAPAPAPAAVASEAPRAGGTAYQLITTEHLSQSEAFLTLFRASVRKGGNEQLASATARQLLATNRLLLDSPAAADARVRLLLQDLELVLAEIAQLSPRPRSRDLDLITDGLERGGVMSRLRTAVPSGPSTTQGAL
jgi:hypothetical protein